jgi:hypothetical protein
MRFYYWRAQNLRRHEDRMKNRTNVYLWLTIIWLILIFSALS